MSEENLYSQTLSEPDPTTLARRQLLASFKDREYRHAFLKEHVRTSTALQIRSLRDQQGMTQDALGKTLGMAQPWVSQLENPDYGKMSVATLLRLAEAFDVALDIKFEPFSRLLKRLPRTSRKDFEIPSFSEEGLTDKTDVEEAAHTLDAVLSQINRTTSKEMGKLAERVPVVQPVSVGRGELIQLIKQPSGRITGAVSNPEATGSMKVPSAAVG